AIIIIYLLRRIVRFLHRKYDLWRQLIRYALRGIDRMNGWQFSTKAMTVIAIVVAGGSLLFWLWPHTPKVAPTSSKIPNLSVLYPGGINPRPVEIDWADMD